MMMEYGWYLVIDALANNDLLNHEKVTELPIMAVCYHLTYLKAKADNEKIKV